MESNLRSLNQTGMGGLEPLLLKFNQSHYSLIILIEHNPIMLVRLVEMNDCVSQDEESKPHCTDVYTLKS